MTDRLCVDCKWYRHVGMFDAEDRRFLNDACVNPKLMKKDYVHGIVSLSGPNYQVPVEPAGYIPLNCYKARREYPGVANPIVCGPDGHLWEPKE